MEYGKKYTEDYPEELEEVMNDWKTLDDVILLSIAFMNLFIANVCDLLDFKGGYFSYNIFRIMYGLLL